MSYDINSQQVDIENLFKQNANDLASIKELYRKLKEIEEKISQIKYIDTKLADKLKKDFQKIKQEYNSLKKVIIDENVQITLLNDIDLINSQIETKANKNEVQNIQTELNNNINAIDLQIETKANKNEVQKVQQQVNNLVLGAIGDGNNAEIIQARGNFSLLSSRLDFTDRINSINFMKNLRKTISGDRTQTEFYFEYPIKKGTKYNIKAEFICSTSAYYSIALCVTSKYSTSTDNVIMNKVTNSTNDTITASKDYSYIYVFIPNLTATLNFEITNNTIEEDLLYLKNKVNENNNNNEWLGKKAIFLGDSLTDGVNTEKVYHQYLLENVGFSECINYGQNGSTIAKNFRGMVERYNSMSDGDIVFVFGGTNDFGSNTPMGNFYSVSEDGTRTLSTDITTFKGALNVIIEGLQKKYNGKQIIFLTPIHRNYIANQFNDLQKNSVGYYLDDYVMSIKEACSIHSVEYIDLFTCSGLNPHVSENANLYFHKGSDELHPNANGHKRIANIIEGRLKYIKPKN